MDFYWIYSLPNSVLYLLIVTIFIGFSLLGSSVFGRFFEKKFQLLSHHNEIVGYFLSMTGVFNGIVLGLFAAGSYSTFKTVETRVKDEAGSLGALYRDVNMLEGPDKSILVRDLKEYATFVVQEAWDLQRKGIIPEKGTIMINNFQSHLSSYKPISEKDFLIYDKTLEQFDEWINQRRGRINSLYDGMPAIIYLVLIISSIVNIIILWLFVIQNKKLDILINTLNGLLTGSLVFVIVAMDNPFRGTFGITERPFIILLQELMK